MSSPSAPKRAASKGSPKGSGRRSSTNQKPHGRGVGSNTKQPWLLYAVLGAAAIAVVVLAVTSLGAPSSSARTETETVAAAKGVVQETASGSGNVEAGVDDQVNFQTSGTLEHVYVKQGQSVKKGQLLAALDPTTADLNLEQAEANLAQAQDTLTTAEDNETTTDDTADDDVASDRSATSVLTDDTRRSSSAEFASYDTQAGATTTPTTAATETEAPLQTATTTTSSPTTTGSGTSTTSASPAKVVTVTVTTPSSTTTSGSSDSGSSRAGSSGSSAAGGSGSSESGASTSGASSSSNSSSTDTAAQVESDKVAVASDKVTVASDEQAVKETKLYAPVAGTIATLSSDSVGTDEGSSSSSSSTSGSSTASSSTASTGSSQTAGSLGGSSSTASTSSGFAEIVNTNTLTMTVAFSEADINEIKVGQPVTVAISALSGVELAGKITAISPTGTTDDDVVSYDATVTIDQTNAKVKAGMTATATVVIDSQSGVTVPSDAVTADTVKLIKSGKVISTPVTVGLRGTSRVVILAGVAAGDELQVTETLPSLGSSTTAASSSSSSAGATSRFGGRAAGGFGGGTGAFSGGAGFSGAAGGGFGG